MYHASVRGAGSDWGPATLAGAAGLWLVLAGGVHAASLAGLCPDGSAFIVQSRANIPCRRAKLMDPSELPPLRPELLPRPYTWHVDHEARNPRNPYNIIDAAQKIRALRAGELGGLPSGPAGAQAAAPVSRAPEPARALVLDDSELRDLLRMVELRQHIAPAVLHVEDARGRLLLAIQLAHSATLERRVHQLQGSGSSGRHVLVFTAHSPSGGEFYPNFLVVQGALTFRPEPSRLDEVAFLIGEPGMLASGTTVLGYIVVPKHFDPAQPMDLWWNDRSVSAVLAPMS